MGAVFSPEIQQRFSVALVKLMLKALEDEIWLSVRALVKIVVYVDNFRILGPKGIVRKLAD